MSSTRRGRGSAIRATRHRRRAINVRARQAGGPAGRRNPATDQSFADIKNLLDKLIAAVNRVPNYDTGVPVDISSASLNSLATVLDGQNRVMAGLEQGLTAARAPRLAAYESEDASAPGLRARMKAIKESVKSQYGTTSPEYAQVKGIKV